MVLKLPFKFFHDGFDTSLIAYKRGINPQKSISARYGEIIKSGAARYFVLNAIERIVYDLLHHDNENNPRLIRLNTFGCWLSPLG